MELDYVQIKEIFELCHKVKPQDTQVLLALGILNFIERNY